MLELNFQHLGLMKKCSLLFGHHLPSLPKHLASVTTILLFAIMGSIVLDFPYNWQYVVFVFPCLATFTQHNGLQLDPCYANDNISFFLKIESYSNMCVNHIFFIHLCVDE
jgi:hypothetical protein